MWLRLTFLAILCSAFLFEFTSPVPAAHRTALVIGNADYDTAPLKNPANDAFDMAKVLRGLGFEVIERTNASKRDMILAVDEFARRLRDAETGVFYFAGHGMQIHGRNYLIPVKAHVTSETDVQFEAMDAGRVLGKMQDAGNKLNIVILDACRDNPFKRSFRTETVGLAQMDAPKGSIIAYATAPGSVAADGRGRNGLYTKHLLKSLATAGLTVQDVFMETGMGVMKETGDKQIPWISSTPVPRYYLASKGKGPEFDAERATLEKERQELERLRAEIEKKQRESQNERVEVASVLQQPTHSSPSPSTSNETDRDGVYLAYANGIVRDTKTGLEWVAGPDEPTTFEEAKSWVQGLNIDGGGWRMPTESELKSLYKTGAGYRNMTPLLKTNGWVVWGVASEGSSDARYFDFDDGGGFRYWGNGNRSTSYDGRAFAVRSRSDG